MSQNGSETLLDRNPTILTGCFGAGKTEMALHIALDSRAEEVVLVDLDLVTPYFRCRECRRKLDSRGVRLLAPGGAGDGGLPVLPPGVWEAMWESERCIVDVGGGESGARVLGALHDTVRRTRAACFMVVNPYRPDSSTVERIVRSVEILESAGRVRFEGLIANPHLGDRTSPDDIVRGVKVVGSAAAEVDRPVVAVGISIHVADDRRYPELRKEWGRWDLEPILIEPHMRAAWF